MECCVVIKHRYIRYQSRVPDTTFIAHMNTVLKIAFLYWNSHIYIRNVSKLETSSHTISAIKAWTQRSELSQKASQQNIPFQMIFTQ